MFTEIMGFHIIPNHFYYPIPEIRKLPDDLWLKNLKLVGVGINDDKILKKLSIFNKQYQEEYNIFPLNKTSNPSQYFVNNGNFGVIDGEILYCMVRYYKPRKIIEIGSGYSTYLIAQAIKKNVVEDNSYKCKLVVIDPFPNELIKNGLLNLSKLIVKKVQNVQHEEFMGLEENDILFIDSSHVLKIGSDVKFLYLEIMPRLQKGVIVHVHDIYLPSEYPKKWIFELFRFWNEQYVLHAFLLFNNSYEVILPGHYMLLKYPQRLDETFKSLKKARAVSVSSFWMKKIE